MSKGLPHGDCPKLFLPSCVPNLCLNLPAVGELDNFGGKLDPDGGVDGERLASFVEGVDHVGLADPCVADDDDYLVSGLLLWKVSFSSKSAYISNIIYALFHHIKFILNWINASIFYILK